MWAISEHESFSLASSAKISVGTSNTINITSLGGLTGSNQTLISAPGGYAAGTFSNFALGTVTGNTISGANVNLLIEGLGIPNQAGGIDPAPGAVFGNNPHDPMGNSDCSGAYNYAVNPDHAKGTYDGGYTVLVYDGGCSG